MYKKKFRWTAEWRDFKTWQLIAPPSYVKIDHRPQLTVENTQVISGNQHYWIPGKSSHSDITITYNDLVDDEGGALFAHWFVDQTNALSNQAPGKWQPELASVILRLHDGCGITLEAWYLERAFIIAAIFGSYTSSTEEDQLDITVRYSELEFFPGTDSMAWLK